MTDFTTLTDIEALLTGPVTGDEARTFLRELIATAPEPIPLEVLNTAGTPESAIIYALGEAEAQRSADRLLFARSAFRSTASRGWLAIVARQQFGVVAKGADFATTNGTLANSGGGVYGPFEPRTLRFRVSATQKIFLNTTTVTITALSSQSIGLIAEEPGSASTAQVGEIDELETPLDGVSITNAQPALGQDEEPAASINDRIDARIGALGVDGATGFSTGATASAFESIAKNGPDNGGGVIRSDGSRISVTRTKLVANLVTNQLILYVADDDGPIAGGDLTLVQSAVQAYAEWIGSVVTVSNVSLVSISVSGAVTIRGTPTDAALNAAVDIAMTAASRTSPIGGFPPGADIPLRFVENAVESVGDAGQTTAFVLVNIVLSDPTGSTALAEDEVVAISRDTLAWTRV